MIVLLHEVFDVSECDEFTYSAGATPLLLVVAGARSHGQECFACIEVLALS